MSYRKKAKKDDERLGSVFLDLLPVGHNLEAGKQEAVFKMLGANKAVEKQLASMHRQLDKTEASRKMYAISKRELNSRHRFAAKVMAFADEVAKIVEEAKSKEFNTQALRKEAMAKVQALIDYAIKKVAVENEGAEYDAIRIQWARVLGYLFQVLKSIMHEYDAAKLNEEVAELREIVDNELLQRKRDKASS